jgi:hypothetical protein
MVVPRQFVIAMIAVSMTPGSPESVKKKFAQKFGVPLYLPKPAPLNVSKPTSGGFGIVGSSKQPAAPRSCSWKRLPPQLTSR